MSNRSYTVTVPSWVVPGTYLDNLRFLADKEDIDGVELLFFIWDEETRLLYEREATEIRSYTERFSFSVHLPDRPTVEHEPLIAATADIARGWIVHPPRVEEAESFAALLRSWRDRYGDRFYLENTRIDRLRTLRTFLPNWPLCMDTGHLLLAGDSPAEYAREHADAIKEIHLHGLGIVDAAAAVDNRLPDHRPFASDEPWYRSLVPFLRRFDGIVNIEVFSWREVEILLSILRSIE